MKPNIDAAIIGVHKCGTTALLETLRQHPDLLSHPSGQWPSFLTEDDYREKFPELFRTFIGAGEPGKKVLIRDTRLYLDVASLARLDEICPGVKVIISIKEPVERAYSAFCFARSKGYEEEADFGRIIEEQRAGPYITGRNLVCNYVSMGFYHRNLAAIEKVLPADRICVIRATDLKADPVGTANRVFGFLGLREYTVTPIVANPTRKERSAELGTLLRSQSGLKTVLKNILPVGARARLRRSLARLNVSREKYPAIRDEHARALREIYEAENRKLSADYGIDFNSPPADVRATGASAGH